MAERLCGPDCIFPDEPHLDPEPDWIGDYPVMHGESDHEHPWRGEPISMGGGWFYTPRRENYCLCGHPEYYTCPAWFNGGGLAGMTIERGPNWTTDTTEVAE